MFLGAPLGEFPVSVVGLVVVLGGAIVGDTIGALLREFAADGEPERDDPLEELRARYARGELSEAEFERKVERLLETEGADVPGGVGASAGTDASAPADADRGRQRGPEPERDSERER